MPRVERLFSDAIEDFERWLATGSPARRDIAITSFTKLDAMLPGHDERRIMGDFQLGVLLISRHSDADSPADLNAGIAHLERGLAAPGLPADVDVDLYHLMLGQALTDRIQRYGRPDYPFPLPGDAEYLGELRRAVGSLGIAAKSSSDAVAPPARAEAARLRDHLLPMLAAAVAMDARKAGRLTDVDELERALRSLPADHPVRPRLTLELGFAHVSRVLRDTTMSATPTASAHREPATRYLTQALALLAPGDPERDLVLATLAQLSHTATMLGLNQPDNDQLTKLVAGMAADPAADPQLRSVVQLIAALSQPGGPASDTEAALTRLAATQRLGEGNETLQWLVQVSLGDLLDHPAAPSASLDDHDARDALYERLLPLVAARARTDAEASPGSQGLVAQLADDAFLRVLAAASQLSEAQLNGDVDGLDAIIRDLEAHVAALPPDHGFRWLATSMLGDAWRAYGQLTGDRSKSMRGLRMMIDSSRQALASPLLVGAAARRMSRQRLAYYEAELASLTGDLRMLSAALRQMSALRDDPHMSQSEQVTWAWRSGMALIRRHELTGERTDLDRAIAHLEQAAGQAGQQDPGNADYGLTQNLSVAYWTRGDRGLRDQEHAIDAGLLALRQRAATVLLQSGAVPGLRLARWHGFFQVVQLVNYCLAEGRVDQAVAALELGRALVLHTATVATDIPSRLAAAGQAALADEWRAEAARGGRLPEGDQFPLPGLDTASPAADQVPALRVPSALRRRVLSALEGIPDGRQLLAAPDLPGLAGALRRAGTDAFVYLIPPLGRDRGRALLLDARGDLSQLPLPGLGDAGPLDAYEAAYQEASRFGWDDPQDWNHALNALCDWAWTAVAGPVLEQSRQWRLGRPPRLVIVPVGRLSLVPWHAARTTGPDGQARYAVRDAVFSYAASAGQFARAAARAARPSSAAPVLVANPTGDLPQAEAEVAELRRRYYPGAVHLGRPRELATGPATPAAVLSRLPGGTGPLASLLHCGCHANVAASLAQSYLALEDGQDLRVADILGQAQRQDPGSPGFLAVLSACLTDLADKDHDEALTLASALLAAGASGVVGARWPVHDGATGLFMVMFHHFLSNGRPHPADALRAAQLWMLDDNRVAPAGLADDLSSAAALPLSGPYFWAAFTHQGAHAPAD